MAPAVQAGTTDSMAKGGRAEADAQEVKAPRTATPRKWQRSWGYPGRPSIPNAESSAWPVTMPV
jgi:hypothetical protein